MTQMQQATPAVDAAAKRPRPDWSLPLAVVGTLAGAALGVLGFWLLLQFRIYAIMLPGVLAGLGGGYPLQRRVLGIGLFAAVVSVVTMLLTEWSFNPFVVDESLRFFLTHLDQLKSAAKLMMVLGVIAAVWFGMGWDSRSH